MASAKCPYTWDTAGGARGRGRLLPLLKLCLWVGSWLAGEIHTEMDVLPSPERQGLDLVCQGEHRAGGDGSRGAVPPGGRLPPGFALGLQGLNRGEHPLRPNGLCRSKGGNRLQDRTAISGWAYKTAWLWSLLSWLVPGGLEEKSLPNAAFPLLFQAPVRFASLLCRAGSQMTRQVRHQKWMEVISVGSVLTEIKHLNLN